MARVLLIWVSVVQVACATEPLLSEDGARLTQAIVGGQPTVEHPAVVALIREAGEPCTGTLIAPRIVLTAAHCVPRLPDSVFFGSDVAAGGEHVEALAVRRHPDFDSQTLSADVALVFLAREVPGVRPLPLNETGLDGSFVGLPITLVGFGLARDGGSGLKRVGTTVIDSYTEEKFTFGPHPAQTCSGDSGGPALAMIGGEERIIGVTSSGDVACGTHGIDIRVDAHLARFIRPAMEAWSPGAAQAGERCLFEEHCGSGVCLAAPDDPLLHYCTLPCQDSAACAMGMECHTDGFCRLPLPTPGAEGAPCGSDGECARGLCFSEQGARTCRPTCSAARACEAGLRCVPDELLPYRSACVPEEDGGCAASPSSHPGGLLPALAIVAALALLGRRQLHRPSALSPSRWRPRGAPPADPTAR